MGMSDLEKLNSALNTAQAGLNLVERLAGFFGRLSDPARRLKYAQYRLLRTELRAIKLEGRKSKRAQNKACELRKELEVWRREVARLKTALSQTPNAPG